MEEVKRVKDILILGGGEVTGHDHTVRDPAAKLYQIDFETLMLKCETPVELRHEKDRVPAEHRTIVLPAGSPIISKKRSYEPDGSWSPVVD